jgi:hypothetical protein
MNTTTATLTPTAISQALAARRERASNEASNYGLFRQANGVYSVITRQGKVYETSATTCTCRDFEYRGGDLGSCKHTYLVRTAEEEHQAVAQAKAAARAQYEARMALDFPVD